MWYATHKIMQQVDAMGKYYYAPLKQNRNVTKTSDPTPYQAVSKLEFSDQELTEGVEIHIKGFAKGKHVKLFKLPVSTNRVNYTKLTLCGLFKRCKQDEINCSNCY